MMTPPPFPPDPSERRDADHMGLLSIFHFVFGGLALVGIGFLGVHYFVMRSFLAHPQIWKGKGGEGPPAAFFEGLFGGLVWLYLVLGFVLVIAGVANILSGVFLRRRRFREFSLVVAALNCVQIPLGTALGGFTIWVLLRESVRRSYVSSDVALAASHRNG